jgi:hypothetical protein
MAFISQSTINYFFPLVFSYQSKSIKKTEQLERTLVIVVLVQAIRQENEIEAL